MPCFIKLHRLDKIDDEPPAVIYKNMDEISTIQERPGGGTDLWAMGRNTWVQETPAQILALIKEAGR